MSRVKILVVWIVVAASAMTVAAAKGDKTTDGSAEQKVLDMSLGNWQGTSTILKAKWNPQEKHLTVTGSNVRILGGRFILGRGKWSNGATFVILTTYDVGKKCYRRWFFDSRGGAFQSTGQWDAESKTMTCKSRHDDGVTSTAKNHIVDSNTEEWSSVSKDKDGEIGFHIKGTSKRVKELPKQKDSPKEKPAVLSAEQKVLDKYLGNWRGTATILKAKWSPEEKHLTVTGSCVRILGGRFILGRGKWSNGGTFVLLRTYDVKKRCYRQWYFDSQGVAFQATGQWDAESKTMTWKSRQDDGVTSTSKNHFLDSNMEEWSSVSKDKDGEIGFHMKGKTTRMKGTKKKDR